MWWYLLSIVVSYFIVRLYLKYDKKAEYNPFLLLLFLMFIPLFNILVPTILFIIDYIDRCNIKVNYKKIFMLK
ncbi:MAG TPA: hypothetical protein GX708_05095 [Gallicola sp.]|nr:hypothetical protein [Gallicola sp.]